MIKHWYDIKKLSVGDTYWAFQLNPNSKGTGFIRKDEPFKVTLKVECSEKYNLQRVENWDINNDRFKNDKTYHSGLDNCYFCDSLLEAKEAYNKVLKKEKNRMLRERPRKISRSWLIERLDMIHPINITHD